MTTIIPTDAQLKQALAKMLPEKVKMALDWGDVDSLQWIESGYKHATSRRVLDTELLHLCWLMEETLSPSQAQAYYQMLPANSVGNQAHATWQQRVIALAKVKGIEIV